MPRLLTPLDPRPQVPDVSELSWWDEFDSAVWREVVASRPVDGIRTEALVDWNNRVRVAGNTPLQRTATALTRVLTTSVPGTWLNPFPSVRTPLPNVVWRGSDGDDNTWFGVDTVKKRYWEASAIGPAIFGSTSLWRSNIVREFDLTKDWLGQPGSISASRIPVWPLVPSIEGLQAGSGGVRHALAFVAGGYGTGQPVWPSRGTDGLVSGHPLVNGSRLRLTRRAFDRLAPLVSTALDAAVLWALQNMGAIVVDRTDPDVGSSLRMPLDSRLKVTLSLQLIDFEVVYG